MSSDTRDVSAVKALADAQTNGNVIGLGKVTGGVVARQDIDDLLLNDAPCFNLFVLALQALQDKTQQSNVMGYYQLATIHGMPLTAWNNIKVTQKTLDGFKNTGVAGYCAHSTDKFPTWHRPYLAALEQTIYSKMAELAGTWLPESERTAQITAAGRFRLPFWDYWKPRGGPVTFPGISENDGTTSYDYDFRIPDIFVAKKVMVRQPTGDTTLVPIDNPLALFTFPSKPQGDVWGGYNLPLDTVRYSGTSRPVTALNQTLNKAREPRNTLFNTMVKDPIYGRYNDFSTNAFGGTTRTAGSLELIHNNYHGNIGGTGSYRGTMSDPRTAAFDPVFWIHHCQIDRLCAVWQAVHPNEWFSGQFAKDGTDPLVPFTFFDAKAGKKADWTSNGVRSTDDLGYTYGDLLGHPANDLANSVRDRYINNYSWASQKRLDPPSGVKITPVFEKAQVFKYDAATRDLLLAESKKSGALEAAFQAASNAPVPDTIAQISIVQPAARMSSSRVALKETPIVEKRVAPSIVPSELLITKPESIDESNVERTWYVDNIVRRLALNGTFTLYFFIGDHDDSNTTLYATQPTLAGITHNFAAPVEQCDNCGRQEEQGQKVSGTVVITPILKDYIGINQLADLTPENVKPFLVKNLKWRIVTNDGQVVNPRFVPDLQIGVSSRIKDVQTGDITYEEHDEIIAEILQHAS